MMKSAIAAVIAAGFLASSASAFAAEPTAQVRAVRLTAADAAKVAQFYQTVFGMSEVQRYERPDLLEIIMNFGATKQAAEANTGPRFIVITPPKDAGPDLASHVVLYVTEIDTLVARVKANGGTVQSGPSVSAASGRTIAMIKDPAGNRVELIQEN